MHGKTRKYEEMRRTDRYAGLAELSQAMIHPVKYSYVTFQLFS